MLPYLIVAVVATAVTALASYAVLLLSRKYQLAPAVRPRDVHRTPTPRLGGVAMFAGLLAAFATGAMLPEFQSLYTESPEMWALAGACTLVAGVGFLDDLLDLDWMVKLGAQFAATGLLAWSGLQIVSLPVGNTLVVGSSVLNFVITVFLMTVVMNAVNFVDGLDGLVAGVAIISNAVFFVYTLMLHDRIGRVDAVTLASLIACVVVAVCVGFLPYNWHHAKMFMGDTGALLVGLLMAASTMSVTGKLNPAALDQKLVLASYIPILLPMAVLALPLADFGLAVFRRLRAGQSPFTADRQHLHHRLLNMGHSPVQAVVIFYLGTAVLSAAVLLVFTLQSYLVPLLVLIIGGTVCVLVLLFPVSRVRTAITSRSLLPLSARVPNERTPE